MAFRFHHSLLSRAAVSVVLSLWYHEDIDSLKRTSVYYGDRVFSLSPFDSLLTNIDSARWTKRLALHGRVKNSVSDLFIPESLRRYLLEFVQIIGENLQDWIEDHCFAPRSSVVMFRNERFTESGPEMAGFTSHSALQESESRVNSLIDVDLRKVLRWSPDCMIDLEQTGEALVRGERDPIKRFRLAYDYCREEEMLRLWPSVRDHFSKLEAWVSNLADHTSALFWWKYFRYFWPESTFTYLLHLEATEYTQGTSLLKHQLLDSCFSINVSYCSPLAVYLPNKIRMEQLDNITVEDYRIAWKRFGVILFRMPENSHARILRDSPKHLLKQLLFWRHQSFFRDTVERNWNMFDGDLFDSILFHIAEGVRWFVDSDIYKSIFRWYWTESPAHLRDVERIFYDRKLKVGRSDTLRHFVVKYFRRSPTAEDTMKRLLFKGRHVLELSMQVRTRDVLTDLVCSCLPAEYVDGTLKMLKNST